MFEILIGLKNESDSHAVKRNEKPDFSTKDSPTPISWTSQSSIPTGHNTHNSRFTGTLLLPQISKKLAPSKI